MWTDFHPDSVAVARPLPREIGQVWLFAVVLGVVACGLVFATTEQIPLTLLAGGVCALGGIVASLKVWLTAHA